MNKKVILEDIPINYKNKINLHSLFCKDICAVSVLYIIYDPKRNTIVHYGENRPCGCNFGRNTIHAEEIALRYCRKYDKRNRFHIYIWRYSKNGHIKKKECCNVCTKLLEKSNYYNKIFTFDNSDIVTAISDNPQISLNYKIKYGLN